MMTHKELLDTVQATLGSNTDDLYAKELGFVHLTLTLDQWEKLQKILPKVPHLVSAVQLVLAIADHQDQNPHEKISLAPKTREQLDSAVSFIENKIR